MLSSLPGRNIMLLPIWLFHVPGSNVTIWFCKKCISLNLGHLSCSRSKCNVTIWFCCTWRKKCISLNRGHPALSGFRFKCNDTILMYQEKDTLPPERTQPQKLCTANFSSGTLKTHKNRPLRQQKKALFLSA